VNGAATGRLSLVPRVPALQVCGLSTPAHAAGRIDGLSFEAMAGDIHALVIDDPADKHALLRMLAGAMPAAAGEIRVDGHNLRPRSPQDSLNAGLCLVTRNEGVLPNLSVAENVLLGIEPHRGPWLSWSRLESGAVQALRRLGSDIAPRLPMAQLSAVQQQLVLMARATARGVRVLLLDEPTASLAPRDSEMLIEAICRLRDDGLAVVYCSHRLDEVYALAGAVTVLREGRVAGRVSGQAVRPQRIIELMRSSTAAGTPATPGTMAPGGCPSGPPVLEVRGLTDGMTVRPASFSMRHGEVLGLTGLASAGPSRLAQMLCGALPASGGEIRVQGRPATPRSPSQAMQAGIAYVPASRGQAGAFPLIGPVETPSPQRRPGGRRPGLHGLWRLLGLPCDNAALMRRCNAAAAAPQDPTTATRPRWLDGLPEGLWHELMLARGIAMRPQVLVLDDPARGLASQQRGELMALARRLANNGSAVLWVTPELAEVAQVCDRALVMCDGEISGEVGAGTRAGWDDELLFSYATGLRRVQG
jgi:ribose transport system ATP-binding protein